MVREKNKQLGRIPNVNHTDHANLARLESIELSPRADPPGLELNKSKESKILFDDSSSNLFKK